MNERHWDSGKILNVSGSYWEAFALHTGVALDVFTILEEKPLKTAALAEKTGADERGIETLLNALAAMGLLSRSGEGFMNTPAAAEFLVNGSRSYIGDLIQHHRHLVTPWARLAEAVRSGSPVRERVRSEEALESFLMGMMNSARRTAPFVVNAIDLAGRHRLLDLGGGPGTYSVHFCRAHAGMKATVFDLPATKPFALRTIKEAGLSDRISFLAGDCLKDDIGGPYDVVWLSHLLHSMGPEECRLVIGKAAAALDPGGLIIVHDFFLCDTRDGPLFPALFSLNMLVNTDRGRAYSEKEIRGMLTGAGVRDINRPPFDSPSESGILCGVV